MANWKDTLVPNVGPHHWVALTHPDTLSASDRDTASRPIGVVFHLEDPRARTQHVYVQLRKEEKEFHRGSGTETVDIWFEENGDGLLQTIVFGLFDTNTQSAFRRASENAYSLLSLWAYQYKRPFAVQEVKLQDKTHNALWIIPKFCPKAVALRTTQMAFSQESPIGSLFALFREGMNSTSSAYRFLSYFKIAEAWKNRLGPFAWLVAEAKRKNRPPSMPVRVVTVEFLGGSYRPAYHDPYVGKKFTWCIDQLEELRAVVAHPFNKASAFTNFDSPDAQAYLGAAANLVERIAIQLLEDFLEEWEAVDEGGLAKQVKSVYAHID